VVPGRRAHRLACILLSRLAVVAARQDRRSFEPNGLEVPSCEVTVPLLAPKSFEEHTPSSTARKGESVVRKLLGAILALVMGLAGLVWALSAFLSSADTPDQGNRGLIVFATSGADRAYKLNVQQLYETDGSLKLLFYLTSKGTTYGEKGNTERVDISVSFVGPSFGDRVSCGTSSDPIVRQPFDSLPQGTQMAVKVDLLGGHASATNYKGTNDPALEQSAQDQVYSEWQGNLWLLDDGSSYSDRVDGWAETCRVPASATWRSAPSPGWSDRHALLPPQIDWTSMGQTTDHQESLWSRITITRAPSQVLQEAYPSVTMILTDQWLYDSSVAWRGASTELGNIAFTDQPVYIFSSRSDSDRRALILVGIGTLLGTLASLLVQILSRGYDILVARHGQTRSGSST